MLALFLDESGIFERKDELILLNAGLVYKGYDYDHDIKNLEDHLKNLCYQFGFEYPRGLHGSEIQNYRIKKQVLESLLTFLALQKSWSIIGIIGGDYEQDKRSNIANEHYASNLYHNMLDHLLDNALYYSSLPENEKNAQIHIASRVAIVEADDYERHQQYKELGYGYNVNNDGSVRYYLIDGDTVRATLGRLYRERANSPHLDFHISVQTLYRDKNAGLETADLICNYLYGQLRQKEEGLGLNKLVANLKETFGLNSYIWVYGQADDNYRVLKNLQLEGKIYEYLDSREQFFAEKHGIVKYYASRWMPRPPIISPPMLEEAIRTLGENRKNPNRNYPRELGIVKQLFQLARADLGEVPPLFDYQLSDLMLQLNNHMGNTEKALVHGERAIAALKQQPHTRDNYQRSLETRLRMSGIETNRFNFLGAIKILSDELAPLLQFRLESSDLDDFGPQIDPTLGKCYSALGQNYAYLKKHDDALKSFNRSLNHFAAEPENMEITITHILHLALSKSDINLFERFAPSYFNDTSDNLGTPERRWQRRWQDAIESKNPYKLLVLLKAINIMESVKEKRVLERFLNADYKAFFVSDNNHPWELIYRHMAEIAFKNGLQQRGKNLIKQSLSVSAPGFTLTFKLLHLGTRMMAGSYLYKEKELSHCYLRAVDELKEICKDAPLDSKHIYSQDDPDSWFFNIVENVETKSSFQEKARTFLGRFTYEYR